MSKTPTPCACSTFFVVVGGVRQGTGCPGTSTTREFAPGHDAKLKGFLIRAGREGQDVTCTDGTTRSAVATASRYGFAHMVEAGISRPAKVRKAKTAAPVVAEAKVGRWVYKGTVEGDTFTYTDKAGVTKTATKFTLV